MKQKLPCQRHKKWQEQTTKKAMTTPKDIVAMAINL